MTTNAPLPVILLGTFSATELSVSFLVRDRISGQAKTCKVPVSACPDVKLQYGPRS